MIRYTLMCAEGHGFDSWFRDSGAYDAIETAGQLVCPSCGSNTVRKALMAPSIRSSRGPAAETPASREPKSEPVPATAPVPEPVALLDPRERRLRELLGAMHREITARAHDVGPDFAREARRIHDGEVAPKSIYGQASRDEVEALLDDGIPFLPMPGRPDDQN